MKRKYKTSFLTKVIAQVDFTTKIEISKNGLSESATKAILKAFPIPEVQERIKKSVEISNKGTKETIDNQVFLFYYGLNKDKTILLTPEFASLEVKLYDTFEKFKTDFFLLLDVIEKEKECSTKRFGLRYINQIVFDEKNPLNWSSYINKELISPINILHDKKYITRVFSNIIQQFDDDMMLNFHFGMHNPDFPSRIKKKSFVLDYDAYYQGLMENQEIKNLIDTSHERIEDLFENSIKESLRQKMGVTENES